MLATINKTAISTSEKPKAVQYIFFSILNCSGFLIKISSTEKEHRYMIVKPERMSNNELLQELMKETEIVAFEELLPSMNEIFIKTVTQNLTSI